MPFSVTVLEWFNYIASLCSKICPSACCKHCWCYSFKKVSTKKQWFYNAATHNTFVSYKGTDATGCWFVPVQCKQFWYSNIYLKWNAPCLSTACKETNYYMISLLPSYWEFCGIHPSWIVYFKKFTGNFHWKYFLDHL